MQIVKLNPPKRKATAAPKARKPKTLWQVINNTSPRRLAAYGIIGVDAGLLGLSLSHLAHGTQLVTQCSTSDAWLMAVGIDAGFVALECAGLAAPDIGKSYWLKGPVLWCLGISASMNATAFAEHANSWPMMVGAIMLGCTIPGLIYAGTHIVAQLLGKR